MTSNPPAPARKDLADFLRNRRARVQPEDVGLPAGARRRTPGLRREELARLAEVGVSWYTSLEQGRDIHVSAPLLERLSRALRLTPTERAHLFELAHGRPAPRPSLAAESVSLALQRVLDAHPFPAMVVTPRRDYLAWNRAATVLYGDFGALPARERNGLWSMFVNRERRAQIPEWELNARRAVAAFRLDAARAADRREFDALVAALTQASPDFARFWRDHEVLEMAEGAKQFVHPTLGAIEFEHITLAHLEPDGRELRVTLYSPRPGLSTERALQLFQPAPPARAVRALKR